MDINFCPKCGSIDIEEVNGRKGFMDEISNQMQFFKCKKCENVGVFPIINSKEYPDFIKNFNKKKF